MKGKLEGKEGELKMRKVRITSDGAIPLPDEIRRELNLNPGDEVLVRVEGRKVTIERPSSPSREKIVRELEMIRSKLKTDEALEKVQEEIEAGREDSWRE